MRRPAELLCPTREGVRVAIRLTPRARDDRLHGIILAAEGGPVLKASVAAPPAEGRANEALLALLARCWHLPRRDLAIVAGAADRTKIVQVAGDAGLLMPRLAALIAASPAA